MKDICFLCDHYISEWQIHTGKVSTLNSVKVHTACLADVAISDLHRLRKEEKK